MFQVKFNVLFHFDPSLLVDNSMKAVVKFYSVSVVIDYYIQMNAIKDFLAHFKMVSSRIVKN